MLNKIRWLDKKEKKNVFRKIHDFRNQLIDNMTVDEIMQQLFIIILMSISVWSIALFVLILESLFWLYTKDD